MPGHPETSPADRERSRDAVSAQGYACTGLNDIVDASGAPKGSLYHYFPAGKASIAVAAV